MDYSGKSQVIDGLQLENPKFWMISGSTRTASWATSSPYLIAGGHPGRA
jgi:hypothetical protein